jgi:hypothetical protein
MIVRVLPVCLVIFSPAGTVLAGEHDWESEAPRDEIRPVFQQHESGSLSITADEREGLNGWWTTTLPVEGRSHFRFSVKRKTTGMSAAEIRRAAIVRLIWENARGGPVIRDEPTFSSYRPGEKPRAEPEFPPDVSTSDGWTTVSQIYRVPVTAKQLKIELHYRWGPPGSGS